jgi:hypothetical protein
VERIDATEYIVTEPSKPAWEFVIPNNLTFSRALSSNKALCGKKWPHFINFTKVTKTG